MHGKIEVMIINEIPPSLSIKGGAKIFFDHIKNIPENEILINFEGSKCISRSFAQEYLKQKKLSNKKIKEINMPDNVSSMLKIVETSPTPSIVEILKEL
jgi:hypothetical protein